MTEDIVKRLREVAGWTHEGMPARELPAAAADKIEQMREDSLSAIRARDAEIERLRTELAVVVADRAAAISHKEALERDRDALDDTLCDIAYLLGCRANTTEPIEAVKSIIAKAAEIERLRAALSHANRMQRETQDARTSDVIAAAIRGENDDRP